MFLIVVDIWRRRDFRCVLDSCRYLEIVIFLYKVASNGKILKCEKFGFLPFDKI